MIKENNILYLSHFINKDTPIYGGAEGKIIIEEVNKISNGDSSNNSYLKMPVHSGTHIDFPYHFNSLSQNSSNYIADFWIFNKVGFVECEIDKLVIEMEKLPKDIELLICKSGFGKNRNNEIYYKEQPIIRASLAKKMKTIFPQLRVFGFDMISLTSKLDRQEGKAAHKAFLLDEEILILEDMKLDNLNKTPKIVIVAPLLIDKVDGSPCTVFAIN
jgi:arylformamidase